MLRLSKPWVTKRWGRAWMPQSETWEQWQTSSCLPLLVQWTKSRESDAPVLSLQSCWRLYACSSLTWPFLSLSYGMRFIAKVLKDSLHDKFPDAGEDELLKVRIYTPLWIIVSQMGCGKAHLILLSLAVCVERSTCKPVHLPLRIENTSHSAIAVSFIHITWDVIHC